MSETNTVSPLRQHMIEDMAPRKAQPTHSAQPHPSCKRSGATGRNASPAPTDKWSTRVFASPRPHGSNNRAKVATLGGQHVLGARRTHRIETPLHDAMLLKCPKTLRQRRRRDAV